MTWVQRAIPIIMLFAANPSGCAKEQTGRQQRPAVRSVQEQLTVKPEQPAKGCDALLSYEQLDPNTKQICLRASATVGHQAAVLCDGQVLVFWDGNYPAVALQAVAAAKGDLASHCNGCEFNRLGDEFDAEVSMCFAVLPPPYDPPRKLVGKVSGADVEVLEMQYTPYTYRTADFNWKGPHEAAMGQARSHGAGDPTVVDVPTRADGSNAHVSNSATPPPPR